jgi:hypothetical protein
MKSNIFLLSKEEFKSLSAKEKRLAIMTDILDSLIYETYIPKTNIYIAVHNDSHSDLDIKSNPDVECSVCAIGGMMISLCKIFNSYTYNDIDYIMGPGNFNNLKFSIKQYFSKYQLRLIEDCFESSGYSSSRFIPNKEFSVKFINISSYIGEIFAEIYPNEKDRLLAIVHNIIYNDGIFKPLQELTQGQILDKLTQNQISFIENLSK